MMSPNVGTSGNVKGKMEYKHLKLRFSKGPSSMLYEEARAKNVKCK